MPRDREYWRRHMLAHRRSRLTQTAYCLQNGLHTKTYRTWCRKLKTAGDVEPHHVPEAAAGAMGQRSLPIRCFQYRGLSGSTWSARSRSGSATRWRSGSNMCWPRYGPACRSSAMPVWRGWPERPAPLETQVCRARRGAAGSTSNRACSRVRLRDRRRSAGPIASRWKPDKWSAHGRGLEQRRHRAGQRTPADGGCAGG